MKFLIFSIIVSLFTLDCTQKSAAVAANNVIAQQDKPALIEKWDETKLALTTEEWKERLDEQQFYVLRQAGTERAFSGDFYANKANGIYSCSGCGLALFDSETKFKSGTGWPSYYTFIENHVGENRDDSFGMTRTEVVCNRCDGHLGHVFDDGPAPTGLRYCINSVSLDFHAAE